MRNLLVLASDISLELKQFLISKSLNLLEGDYLHSEIDYIIIDKESQIKDVSNNYDADKNQIQIICLNHVYDQKTFLTFNGRLSLDSAYLKSNLGYKILEKFFDEIKSIHLNDHLNTHFEQELSEFKSFKITNHLSSGIYLDELTTNSFKAGFNLLSIRSYLDHVLSYFTYLKQAGLAGVPYEVEYAHTNEFFIVNTYLTVREFFAEYMIDSFGKVNSKEPLKYLLGVAAEASDFMEVTYFENPGRLALTAIWDKNEVSYGTSVAFHNIQSLSDIRKKVDFKIQKFENSTSKYKELEREQDKLKSKLLPGGIRVLAEKELDGRSDDVDEELFAVLMARATREFDSLDDITIEDIENILDDLPSEFDDKVESLLTSESKLHEILNRIKNPNISKAIEARIQESREKLKGDEDLKELLRSNLVKELSDRVVDRVSDSLDSEAINKILAQQDDDIDSQTLVKGSKDKEELVRKITGVRENKDDFIQVVRASLDENQDELKKVFNADIDPLEKKEIFRSLIDVRTSKIEEYFPELSSDISNGYLKEVLSREIELGLEEYAQKMGKTFESLTEFDFDEFQNKAIPSILDHFISSDDLLEDYVESSEDISTVMDEGFQKILRDKLHAQFENHFKEDDRVSEESGVLVVTDSLVDEADFKELVRDTMRESLDSHIAFDEGSLEELETKEEQIVKDLSIIARKEHHDEVKEAVSVAIESTKKVETTEVAKNISDHVDHTDNAISMNNTEKELLRRVKKSELALKKLETQNKLLEGKLLAEKKATERLEKINEKSNQAFQEKEFSHSENSDGEVEIDILKPLNEDEVLLDLSREKPLDDSQKQKIKKILAKEQKLTSLNVEQSLHIKKLEHEVSHKDSLFQSEVARVERASKGKDIVLEKTKGHLTNLVKQKESENQDLQNQVRTLTKKLKNDESHALKKDMLQLKKDNELLAKSAEMFKSRIESMSKMKQADADKTDSEKIVETNRMLKIEKIGLENKVKTFEKEVKAWEMRLLKSQEFEKKSKEEVLFLKKKLDTAEEQIRAHKADSIKKSHSAATAEGKNQDLDAKEISSLKSQNLQLQKKLKHVLENNKSSNKSSSTQVQTSKEKLMEKEKKRLQGEVAKTKQDADNVRKSAIKLKGENMKLRNITEKYQRDIAKLEKKLKSLASLSGKKAA